MLISIPEDIFDKSIKLFRDVEIQSDEITSVYMLLDDICAIKIEDRCYISSQFAERLKQELSNAMIGLQNNVSTIIH